MQKKKKKSFFTVNESKNFVHLDVHFMKWTVDFLSISRNGQTFCPFHEMDIWVVHFVKWTISHLGRNIYITSNLRKIDIPSSLSCNPATGRLDSALSPTW